MSFATGSLSASASGLSLLVLTAVSLASTGKSSGWIAGFLVAFLSQCCLTSRLAPAPSVRPAQSDAILAESARLVRPPSPVSRR
jgi:hypothetical protein